MIFLKEDIKLKIAIIGYGNMGKILEQAAIEQGYRIAAVVDPVVMDSHDVMLFSDAPLCRDLSEAGNLWDADVAIEFTQPDSALKNIKALAEKKIPAVIGTTGWHDRLDDVRRIVDRAGSSLIWSSNFSLGVNLFYRIAWYAAQLVDSLPEYDMGGFEAHHRNKLDSPSGTAKTLVDGVLERVKRKEKAVWETLESRRPQPEELHFSSLRLGSVPGQHSFFLDSAADTIEITHTARNREGFAAGALYAAKWLLNGDAGIRKGLFTIDDMLKEMLGHSEQ